MVPIEERPQRLHNKPRNVAVGFAVTMRTDDIAN